jgi:crotonobetainyl-CoA:carnitine CoA-transferase CaiB-like acyl-CoA transferase
LFEAYLRLGPLATFSRSATSTRGGCLVREHTDAVLTELGRSADEITELRDAKIVV